MPSLKWVISNTNPILKAQGASWKRNQQDCKSKGPWSSALRWCFLDITVKQPTGNFNNLTVWARSEQFQHQLVSSCSGGELMGSSPKWRAASKELLLKEGELIFSRDRLTNYFIIYPVTIDHHKTYAHKQN